MDKEVNKQNEGCSVTNEAHKTFVVSYKKLIHGQKQMLHNLIIAQLQIPYKEVTIRTYCNRPGRIPEEKQQFFIALMYGSLITLYNQLIDSWENDVVEAKESINQLSEKLKNYGKKN